MMQEESAGVLQGCASRCEKSSRLVKGRWQTYRPGSDVACQDQIRAHDADVDRSVIGILVCAPPCVASGD